MISQKVFDKLLTEVQNTINDTSTPQDKLKAVLAVLGKNKMPLMFNGQTIASLLEKVL